MADWQYSGTNGPIDQGYFVKLPNINPAERKANAYITNHNGDYVGLWVNDLSASFQMGGTFAQSKYQRSYFSGSFSQPSFTVHGQMPNSYQYQRLAEFVRESQLHILSNSSLRAKGLMAFTLLSDNDSRHPGGTPGVAQRQAGPHMEHQMIGYINQISRGAERWDNAPAFQFDFTVAYSNQGLFSTDQAFINDLPNWADIFKKGMVFTKDPDGNDVGGGGAAPAAPDGHGGMRPT